MILSSAGTWTNPGRYHHLPRQPHVRQITDTRGSPAAAHRGWIPETVWSFCSSWRLTCSKVKWDSVRTGALLSSPACPEKVRAATSGQTYAFSFQKTEPRVDRKSRAGWKVYEWASDVASAGVTAGAKALQHQLSQSEPSNLSFVFALSSLSSTLSRCFEEVQPDRMQQDYKRRSGRRTREAERWGSSGWRCALSWSLSHSVKAGMTRLELAAATKV